MTAHKENIQLPIIAILGLGSMGGAILSGLRNPLVRPSGGIRVTNRTASKAAAFDGDDDVIAYALENDPDANRRAVTGAQIVLVAVKPWMVSDLMAEIADALEPGTIVVSVASGVASKTYEDALPPNISVLRSMPNTPAVVGKAVTGLSHGSRSSEADLKLVTAVFETVGTVIVVPESQLDALSTISGSGPAYVFLFIEKLMAAAVSLGFDAEQARVLVEGTFAGASELVVATGTNPAELRRQVTSPQGTTERAIAVFQKHIPDKVFVDAVEAALARARELGSSP
ncbi:pyrroline-5-carboxylate reductase [Lysinibacter sp. HNR]|uniref:pyrroline-5-carboxylate reductase n=1 Tax=Lysinibacter sp. HNR TaxID=3031408 RepID=UPI002434CCB9|nr:pyrroline-5-carboxylate reductase [Lysinibacter sp. HNR]WGD37623.1 pyrroline-5-carboxylate reductase [Lysinibacter sp. HNR]